MVAVPDIFCTAVKPFNTNVLAAVFNAPLWIKFPPTEWELAPASKLVFAPNDKLPTITILEGVVTLTVPAKVKFPKIDKFVAGNVFIPLPLKVKLE